MVARLTARLFVLGATTAQADVLWVPGIFSEKMVLPRQMPIPVWGRAAIDGRQLLVTGAAGQTYRGVRYACRGFPEVTLCNSAGLPATAFMYPRPELKGGECAGIAGAKCWDWKFL